MTYVSRFGPRKNENNYLYTKGGEFSLNGVNYIGEYHLDGTVPRVGPILDSNAPTLLKYYANKDHFTYDKIFNFNVKVSNFVEPKYYMYTPTEQSYAVGFDLRYFVEKINDDQSYAVEIDEKQYKRLNKSNGIDGGLYTSAILKWRLTGSQKVIIEHNTREIQIGSTSVPSIQYAIKNYTEFARITLA